ncbi:MAG: glycosyltransferase family 2 protein [Candidatus Levybacteria bacterium]|nr:glycosyltransferase family 2 protein [Candidatus Levybacteria bacterium]
MKLSIIILSYNTEKLTLTCLFSLVKYYKKELTEKTFEIIVVDNNSSDTSVESIKSSSISSFVTVVVSKENLGFSKGINLGATYATGEQLLFLNSDTECEDDGLMNMMVYKEEHTQIGIMGGRLKNPDGSYQASAGVFYTLPRVFLLLAGAERFGKLRYNPKKIEKVDWVSGAMLIVDRTLFRELGGFDEKLFMYMEDMELCFRVKKMGKEVVFYPECTIQHLSHGSSNRGFAIIQIYRGMIYFYKKHKNSIEYTIVKGLLVIKAVSMMFLGVIIGKKEYTHTYGKALKSII